MSLTALSSTALAANSDLGKLQVEADTIKVDSKNVLHAAGHAVITVGDTTIKMDKAAVSKKNGKTVIEAEPAKIRN
ncbi:hypothetical protein ATN84_01210 [Paramesorhizobium deserti]|uniref:Organic solvent tolerance-like N-terminal domain-containing protein n=2 Tax=Paramesorhizobium deserti TaxID=1494590 RepID=A0A135HZ28_9HYPH|nr:hypothetical protein ATN84_01210 [Paramesorhizobium deserti]